MKKTDPAALLVYGLHLGHKKTKVHPKSRKYIYKLENGTSIIDLFKTAELLDQAKEYMARLAKDGKQVLFVGTKKVAREAFSDYVTQHNLHSMTNKWVGGFLTNFSEVSKNVQHMNELRQQQVEGAWNILPKHERTALEKKLNRISSIYGGVMNLTALPDALFILDVRKERNALLEAMQLGIPIVAVTDTNVDPDDVTYPIPANDDAVTSVKYIIDEIVKAYVNVTTTKEDVQKAENAKDTKKTKNGQLVAEVAIKAKDKSKAKDKVIPSAKP